MKKICLLFFIMQVCPLFSQTELKVLNSAAFSLNNSNYAFDVSIGEVMTNTIGTNNSLLTQGFLQTNIETTNSLVFNETINTVLVYPNPFDDVLMISSKEQGLRCLITDNTGRTVYESSQCDLIHLGFLNAGIYSLMIYNSSGSIVSTHKICKIN